MLNALYLTPGENDREVKGQRGNELINILLTSLYPKMMRPSMRRVAWNVKLPRL